MGGLRPDCVFQPAKFRPDSQNIPWKSGWEDYFFAAAAQFSLTSESMHHSPSAAPAVLPERQPHAEGNFYVVKPEGVGPGMNPRIQRLRKLSFECEPSISIERALHQTAFYQANNGRYSVPVMRALQFLDHCEKKTLYLGEDELIVGERGPLPKAVPTFPELTCHSVEDFHVLNTRDQQRYHVAAEDIARYAEEVIPYWQGRTMRSVFSTTCRTLGGGHTSPVFSLSSWSSVLRAIPCSMGKSTSKACSISSGRSRPTSIRWTI